MPVPRMWRGQPKWRFFREASVVPVLTAAFVCRVVGAVEQSHIRLLVECDLDNIARVEVEFVVQEVHSLVQRLCDITP